MKKLIFLLPFLGILSLLLFSCSKKDSDSSSSSSDTVSAVSGSGSITLSSKVSVVEAKSSASTARSTSRTAFAIDTGSFASTADYNMDETDTFVFEKSADVLKTVNSILCQISQTRADLMLNAGNYKAQVDTNKCGEGSGDSKSNAPKYEMWTVNASRSKGDPMIVKAWVPNDENQDGTPDGLIHAKMKIYQPPSTDYPVGFFKMSFKAVSNAGVESMKGYMGTKKSGTTNILKFYMPMTMSGTTYDYAAAVNFNSDGSGSGATTMPNWTGENQASGASTYNIAYTSKYFYKQKTKAGVAKDPICLDRNKYLTSAWRYGLYSSTGSRVTVNSGFPISATTSGTTYHGYIGYHGLWMPTEAGVTDNSTVYKMDFSNPDSSGTAYTVRSYGGKLFKHTKQTITLDNIKNIPLSWWDSSASTEKRVYWNGTNLIVDAVRDSNWQWTDQTAATLTLTASNAPWGFWFWSRALGGDGQIDLSYSTQGAAPTAPSGSTSVIFNTREPVFPGDSAPTTLACYERCPNPDTIATGSEWGSSSVFLANKSTWLYSSNIDNASAPDPYIYTFDNTTSGMVLQYDNGTKTPVVLSSTNSNLSWGLNTGVLFDNSTSANFTAIQCSWDSTKICPWEARSSLSTFYTWETGANDWNKLTVLVGSDNSSVKFDPPMMVKYTHSGTSSNSGKSYDGASFYLDYGGFGDLWGVPSFCVDVKTGEKTSCANDQSTRWVNEFVIPAASLVTQVKDSSVEYVVKPLQIEQTMKKTSSVSVCTDAGLSLGGVSLPDSSNWTDPDIGTKPTVIGPPSVVAGAKKGS
ncbi:MAG: hypothetical protein H8E38_12905 [SAR324 cluster bacterium]|nr:hypothetical protein [SAR324 cluster bacterium]